MKSYLIIAALLLGIGTLHAKTGINVGNPIGVNPLKPGSALKGLLNSTKFDMHQTVGMNIGTGGSGFSQYYLNAMTYKASDKLTVNATLGLQNQAYGSGFYGSATNGARIVVPKRGHHLPSQAKHDLPHRLQQRSQPLLPILLESLVVERHHSLHHDTRGLTPRVFLLPPTCRR